MIDYSAMYGKKKRAVDPNAPPRPNLLSHEKTLKDTKSVIERQQQQIQIILIMMHLLRRQL